MNYNEWLKDNPYGTPREFVTWCEENGIVPNLRRATLLYASFEGTKLERANLFCAQLRHASFSGATMVQANLHSTNAEFANLERVNLKGATLEGASLKYASMLNAYMENANMAQASFESASLRGANMEYANLEGANLTRANLERANLKYANLEGADTTDAIFTTPLGMSSRNDDLAYSVDANGIVTLHAGCWKGDVASFVERIMQSDKSDDAKLAYLYRAASIVTLHQEANAEGYAALKATIAELEGES